MGILNSKISPSSSTLPTVEQGNALFHDPRSPTLNINRSPISQESGNSIVSVTRAKDLTSELAYSEGASLQTPYNLLPKRFQSIVDPRSPSTFTRTPLVVDPSSVGDCSLTTVVSSLQYEDCSIIHEDNVDTSFKDCDPQIPEICNLQIEYDDSIPIIDPTDEKEDTIFEDAEVIPFAGNDPRSPCIAIARTPMVLLDEGVRNDEANIVQVGNDQDSTAQTKAIVESQQRTPNQGIPECNSWREHTPTKDKFTPNALKAGNRTPLGCVTNIGAVSNIRKMALMGQMKQINGTDEQKLLSRSGSFGSAELNASSKNIHRSRIPKLRLS